MKVRKFNEYNSINEMKVEFLDKIFNLREYSQYKDIPYNKSTACNNCGHGNFLSRNTCDLVGYCNTEFGYMGVFECLKCGELYRHHITYTRYDLEDFKEQAGIFLNFKSKMSAYT